MLPLYEEARSVLRRRGRGSPAKLRREVRLRSMGDSLAVAERNGNYGRRGCSRGGVSQWYQCKCLCGVSRQRAWVGVGVGVAGVQGLTEAHYGLTTAYVAFRRAAGGAGWGVGGLAERAAERAADGRCAQVSSGQDGRVSAGRQQRCGVSPVRAKA